MDERNDKAAGHEHTGGLEGRTADAKSSWPRGMDPHYSSHRGNCPWSDTEASSGRLSPMLPAGDFAWAQDLQDERAVQLKAELRRRLLALWPALPQLGESLSVWEQGRGSFRTVP